MKSTVPSLVLLLFVSLSLPGPALAEEAAPAAPAAPPVRVVRDLAKLPAGEYEIVQTWRSESSRRKDYVEPPEEPKKSSNENRLLFDLSVPAAVEPGQPRIATVKVRSVRIQVVDEREYSFDSDSEDDSGAGTLARQFRTIVGRVARVDLAALDGGTGFEGLGAAWDGFAKENPDLAKAAASNRENFGDPRLDRIFSLGVDVLFRPVGRPPRTARDLAVGEEFEFTRDEPGIGYEAKAIVHPARVVSAADGRVVVEARWHENGLAPEEGAEVLTIRGGDMKGRETLTFLAGSGLVVESVSEVVRTDQVARGMPPVQWTTHTTQRSTLTITPKPAAPPPGLFDRANERFEAGDYADALALFEELLEAEPEATGALYNGGLCAYLLGKYGKASELWLRLKALEPGDWQVRAKLVQAWQALDAKERRDAERKELYDLRATLDDPELRDREFFCRDQFRAAGHRVVAFEHFELVGPRAIRYYFAVTDPEGRQFHISLGSYDTMNRIVKEAYGEDAPRRFHLDGYYDDGHATFMMYVGEPGYDEVREQVVEILLGTRKPISSSRLGPPSPEKEGGGEKR